MQYCANIYQYFLPKEAEVDYKQIPDYIKQYIDSYNNGRLTNAEKQYAVDTYSGPFPKELFNKIVKKRNQYDAQTGKNNKGNLLVQNDEELEKLVQELSKYGEESATTMQKSSAKPKIYAQEIRINVNDLLVEDENDCNRIQTPDRAVTLTQRIILRGDSMIASPNPFINSSFCTSDNSELIDKAKVVYPNKQIKTLSQHSTVTPKTFHRSHAGLCR